MVEKAAVSCARPTGGPVGEDVEETTHTMNEPKKEEINMIKVGQKAPDFTASGYLKGEFISTQLSEYLGKWVLLCFYPGDFTFV